MRRIADVVFFGTSNPNEYLNSISEQKRCLFYIMAFDGEVDNGGLTEYFCGPHGEDAVTCAEYLEVIQAPLTKKSLLKAVSALPDVFVQLGRDERERAVFDLCRESDVDCFEDVVGFTREDLDYEILYQFCMRTQS